MRIGILGWHFWVFELARVLDAWMISNADVNRNIDIDVPRCTDILARGELFHNPIMSLFRAE